MKSKDFVEGIPAVCVDSFEELLQHVDESVRTIFIDEVQLMNGSVSVLTYLSIVYDMDIFLAGLDLTSEQEPFLIMPQILAISDETVFVQGVIDGLLINGTDCEIVDYKTDRVSSAEELCEKYREQMKMYKKAAQDCFGLQNVTITLYSFHLSKEISLKV